MSESLEQRVEELEKKVVALEVQVQKQPELISIVVEKLIKECSEVIEAI